MRQVDPKVLEDRKKKILQAVIHHYIKTAKPVGSNILTEEYKFDLSPATIRNFMAELENDGYLTHPHTSAGRVPTDKGYRSYVDSLIEIQMMILEEEDRVRHEYTVRVKEFEELLTQTSKVLSGLSHYTGFVLTPKIESNQLKRLELVQVSEDKILAILITHTGLIKHRLIEAKIPKERLLTLSNMLNDKLHGLNLSEAKQSIYDYIDEIDREDREIISLAKSLGPKIFDIEDHVYMEGTSNVLSLPEFKDFESMRCLLRLSEERELLLRALDKGISSDKGVKVLIGSETDCKELKHMSVVSSIYKDGEKPIGILGIIGPKRMEYPRMMALVSAVSKIVNKLLVKIGG
ncbi:MAG: heat-inducible transcriptional repressor HrcA [Elusimicrobiota bacterium]